MLLPNTKLTRRLRDDLVPVQDYEIREAAFLGFALLGDEASSAVPALLRLAEDPDTSRTYRALSAISCLGNRGLRELMTIANDSQSPNQILAIKQFAKMRHMGTNASPAVPILVRCAADPDPDIAWEAIYSLCNLGQEFDLCFPVFTNAVASTNKNLRISTIHHLGYFGPAAVLRPLTPSLLNCLNDPDAYVRAKATEALTYIAPEALSNSPAQ
jgi:HEAT repeat protein